MLKLKQLLWLTLGVIMTTNANAETKLEQATLGGGCFWCMEKPFEDLYGVKSVTSGYSGGETENPTYKDVSSGKSGHIEVVEIKYDPTLISYEEIIKTYWVNIDTENPNGQFCDIGPQYKTIIFYHNEEQRKIAEKTKAEVEKTGRTVTTTIKPAKTFYKAEEYHQDFYKKNPVRYKYYALTCGREKRLQNLWGENKSFPSEKLNEKW